MTFYTETVENRVFWPAPIERMYQLLGGGEATHLAPKLPHLGMADILFMTLVMNLPKERRPWGIVTWMSDVFGLSRPSLYALSGRVCERLSPPGQALLPAPDSDQEERKCAEARLVRTLLTAAFPGKVALRPLQQILDEALGERRSIGWLSERLTEAGQRAGQVLSQIDTSPLGPLVAVRDETFFQSQPLLLVIDPVSTVILQATVAPDRQAETWGAVLLETQDRGVTLMGVTEDMARMYGSSLEEAELDLGVQKDVWHVERDGGPIRTDLERTALAATRQVMKLEKQLLKEWDDILFEQRYIPAVAKEEKCYEQHAAFSTWLGHFCDALEVVDLVSGEIRDQATNAWLLDACLTACEQIDHERVAKWTRSLRRYQGQLLTYLEWLHGALTPYEQDLAHNLPDPTARKQFMRLVARTWRLKQACINGHTQFTAWARTCEAALQVALGGSPTLAHYAQRLRDILNGAVRASSLVESINGLLKQFLHNRRSFRNSVTLQHYLNLFTLWHNMRVYQRGKRQGQSPYQLAGIQPGADDWLELIGYPAVA